MTRKDAVKTQKKQFYSDDEKEKIASYLRKDFAPEGSVIYTVLHGRTGNKLVIDCFVIHTFESKPQLLPLTVFLQNLLDLPIRRRLYSRGVLVQDDPAEVGQHLIERLSLAVFGRPDAYTQEWI